MSGTRLRWWEMTPLRLGFSVLGASVVLLIVPQTRDLGSFLLLFAVGYLMGVLL